ncbi:MAG: Asp-tRNA(Asn)/Glu-tRNA(Gln) amidotransferase subunit GatB [Candidatus Woesearchaeota archaeon]|nr:Asp-tRNA(Asn)/Glu-tRNA(Gln) amidotransferase subunit GatB [Candidatus Woesearchaeota archaeon]MDP7198430.1 Asp-tRNA(Asn)/Glu-tRNA(Gln) amidotransferase subunit GatB [Candidatus Woesearchaeota archaeon]MDP7467531.1 Asp-tRNA(Asn)/Glu-tRNA(Gln) amidotransferase subunit GatB [Candidatus Woesearchaeota archaeon]MDP7646552.1 Asp-tRNA(Asn)/Glu-tRNA(Gln) amidotransferase subunit GatB [Candidatus Woesearchaeota archaeon]
MQSDMIIGMEVHIQLNTNTKLFCGCKIENAQPNTRTCPVCLGHPGSRPTLNKRAIEYATKMALALQSTIASQLVFSRKTYFYPDMGKNYQITQYETPLAENGTVVLSDGTKVRIKRLHVEEDPAGMVHEEGLSLVDYNRSGIPLIEVVTEPDMISPEQAREFMKKLQSILAYLDIFASDGIIKADVNVSVKSSGFERVEVKNVTGFKEIERCVEYEVKRQQTDTVVKETRAWNAELGRTRSLRLKESEEDYGYITDPDLVVRPIEPAFVESIQKTLPELPEEKTARFVKEHKLDAIDARIIAAEPDVAALYEESSKQVSPVLAARWVRRELLRSLNTQGKKLKDTPLRAHHVIPLFKLIENKQITDRVGQKLIRELAEEPFDVAERVQKEGLTAVSDTGEIGTAVDETLSENPQALQDFKQGEAKAFEFLMGQIMRKTKGKALPDVVRKLLEEKIK